MSVCATQMALSCQISSSSKLESLSKPSMCVCVCVVSCSDLLYVCMFQGFEVETGGLAFSVCTCITVAVFLSDCSFAVLT